MSSTDKTVPRLPRGLGAWRFHDERAAGYRPQVTPEGKFVLDRWEMSAAHFFTHAVEGAKSVVDVGCGAGFPSLLVSPEVERISACDSSFNMVAVAAQRARLLRCDNVEFCVAHGQDLPFADTQFDGAILCAILANTVAPEALVSEVRRLLEPGARIACLERNWQGDAGRATGPPVLRRFYLARGELFYQFSERLAVAGRERNYRFRIDPESDLGRQMLAVAPLRDRYTLSTEMEPADLPVGAVTGAWLDESCGLTPETLTELFEESGFTDISLDIETLWSREEQMLLTCRAPGSHQTQAE